MNVSRSGLGRRSAARAVRAGCGANPPEPARAGFGGRLASAMRRSSS